MENSKIPRFAWNDNFLCLFFGMSPKSTIGFFAHSRKASLPSAEVTITPHHPGESFVMVKAAQSYSHCHISIFYIGSIANFGRDTNLLFGDDI
jgi:hypothetical protein